jgi:tripartite-type tricarboxylate transporter receptor subunit TctC
MPEILTIIRFFLLASVFSAGIIFSPALWAQEYPAKPIEMIANFPPGGAAPMIGVMIAERSKKYLSQPVVPVYKTGAAGTIGTYYVSKSAPDGYTLLITSMAPIAATPFVQKVEYDPLDLEPIALIGRYPLALTVRADAPWKTLKDLISYAKNNPDVVTCGNGGTNSSMHLYAVLFEKKAGIRLTHVPFAGGAPRLTALAGGHVSVATRMPGEFEALIEAGKIRDLAFFSAKRYRLYPHVPTSQEQGVPMEAHNWAALMAPKGTPRKIIELWENVIEKIIQEPSFIEMVEKLKMNIEFRKGEDFKKDLLKDIQDFRDIAKELGLSPK